MLKIISLFTAFCLIMPCQMTQTAHFNVTNKPKLEFFDTSKLLWQPVPNTPKMYFKTLAQDSSVKEDVTILYKYEQGLHLPQVITHEFWEEVYLLDGEIYDERLGQSFGKGFYACRPPGMPHGPYRILGNDCIMLVTTRRA